MGLCHAAESVRRPDGGEGGGGPIMFFYAATNLRMFVITGCYIRKVDILFHDD